MACAKKVFSYGVKKKSGSNGSPWADILKEETKKGTKLPFKKGVWAKVNGGKTISPLPLKKTFDEYDPFALPDDNDEVLDRSLTIIQRDHKSPKKNTNSFKSRYSNDLQIKKDEEKLENKRLNNSKKNDVQSPKSPKAPKAFYGSGKKLFGKPLPKKSVTISVDDLTKVGSPKKSDSSVTDKNGQNDFKPLKLTPTKANLNKSSTPRTNSSGLIALKCTPVISSKSKAKAALIKSPPPKSPPPKSPANVPAKNTAKITSSKVKTAKGNSLKTGPKSTSKTLKDTSKAIPKGTKNTPKVTAAKTKSAKTSKAKTKEVKSKTTKTKVTKSTPVKTTTKSTPGRATSSKRSAVRSNTPKNNAAKLKAAKSSLAKAKAAGRTPARTPKLATPKVTKGGVTKAKVIKNGSASVAKKYVKLSKKVDKVTPKKQVTKTIKKSPEKKRKVISPIKTTPKKNLKGCFAEDSKNDSPIRQRKSNLNNSVTVLQTKSPNSKQNSKKNLVAVQFVDDNSVVAIQPKDARNESKKDDNEINSVLEDIDKQKEEEAKSKRSLFSYYDRMNSQIETNENGDIMDFDFDTNNDDADKVEKNSNSEKTEKDKKNSFSLKRSLSEDVESSSFAKKSKPEETLARSITFDSNDKSDAEFESLSSLKEPKKSPFKPHKMFQKAKKNSRRISSLPTNVTLEEEDEEEEEKHEMQTPPPLYRSNIFGFGKSVSPAINSRVRVRRDEKELYTVVRNTKHAHECLEYGESQQFKDDLEYLLDGIKSKHNTSTRCLTALELASKCLTPEFRMHVKAHGVTETIFANLEDATEEQLLLCASMIMYVLAKDKLKINFNKKTIGFMLQVITNNRPDVNKSASYERIIKKIRAIFVKLEDVDIDVDKIDAKTLARQALLALTVKRTGDWFRDEIRILGGLDDIAEQVYACSKCIQKRSNVDENCIQMKRCLSLFIDMTYKSSENQIYLVTCRNSIVLESCISTLYTITTNLEYDKEVSTALAESLMSIQLLLMNLSHENADACLKICKQENGLSSILQCALHLSQYLPTTLAYENTIVMISSILDSANRLTENRIIKSIISGSCSCTMKKILDEEIHEIYNLNNFSIKKSVSCNFDKENFLKDTLAMSLCLLVNLVANNPQNRTILNKTVTKTYSGLNNKKEKTSPRRKLTSPVEALMQMFLLHAEACKEADLMQELEKLEQEEKEQDAGRLYQDDEYGLTCGDVFEDTIEDENNPQASSSSKEPSSKEGPLNETEKRDIQSTLDKAQKHMEDSHLAAYTALLIGLLIENEADNQKLVHSLLPDGDFSLLLDSIEKIVQFMQMTHPLSKNDHETMQRIIEVIRSCNEQFKEKG